MKEYLKHKIKRFLLKKSLILLKIILVKTAWLWGPVLLLLFFCFAVYVMLFQLPQQAVHDHSLSDEDRVAAFFFGTLAGEYDITIFDQYREVAGRWDEELDEEQRAQVSMYNLTWEWLAQVDRGLNDPAFLSLYLDNEDSNEFIPRPEETFEVVRPVFKWEEGQRIITTESCVPHEEVYYELDEKTGEEMEKTRTVYRIEATTTVEPQIMLVRAETVEGIYEHVWERHTSETEIPSSECGNMTKTITEYRLSDIQQIIGEWEPLRELLTAHGVDRIQDQEFWIEYWTAFMYMSHDGEGMEFIPVEGEWVWPASGRISSGFGARVDPITGVEAKHNGVDIAAPKGTPVYSGLSGRVIWADDMGTAGNAVIIQHDERLETRYYHLSYISVSKDQQVTAGEKIGEVGTTGRSTGNHLHYELRVGGKPVDPIDYYR